MYDSRTDAPNGGVHWRRHNYRRENLFVGWNVSRGLTYRQSHQEPAPEVEPTCDNGVVVLRPGKTQRDRTERLMVQATGVSTAQLLAEVAYERFGWTGRR